MTTDKIVVKWAYTYTWSTEYTADGWFSYKNNDDKYLIEQYLIPMCPNTLIAVQIGNYFNFYDKKLEINDKTLVYKELVVKEYELKP